MERGFNRCRTNRTNNNIMNIYKTNFPTEKDGKDYLLSIGVLIKIDEDNGKQIVFAKDTAAVVYIGKVVKIPATYDADGNIITPAVFYPGYAIDVMSKISNLDFGAFMVYPVEAAHSFYGYARNAEVPPTKKTEILDIEPKIIKE